MYQISVIPYLNTITKEYLKIITINIMPTDSLQSICMRLNYSKLSPFKENTTSCIIAFRGENNQPMEIEDLPLLIPMFIERNYIVDYKITKLFEYILLGAYSLTSESSNAMENPSSMVKGTFRRSI